MRLKLTLNFIADSFVFIGNQYRRIVMHSNSTSCLLPVIIGVSDSSHYLVGMIDSRDNLGGLEQNTKAAMFKSLVDAKAYLRRHNIFSALLEFQSAYDEMCGQSTFGCYRERVSF
jgi:hypothetical protein